MNLNVFSLFLLLPLLDIKYIDDFFKTIFGFMDSIKGVYISVL